MICRVDWLTGALIWAITGVVVYLGVTFGVSVLPQLRSPNPPTASHQNPWANWDGEWYARVAEDGYTWDQSQHSSVAFFPLFPVLGSYLSDAVQLPEDQVLVVVAQTCLLVSLVLLSAYLRLENNLTDKPDIAIVVLLFGLWPPTVFFRMAYSESLFVMLSLFVLYGVRRQWPIPEIAAIAGLATATRSVGVVLLPVVLLCAWRRDGTLFQKVIRLLVVTPLAVSGLLSFMAYQWILFDDPLAFVHAQDRWTMRSNLPLGGHVFGLLTLAPVRVVYDSSDVAYWGRFEAASGPLFNLGFANPIYFLGTGVVLGIGVFKRWLTHEETVFGFGLLLIPYCLHSYRIGMQGHARMAAVAIPFYFVLGRLLLKLPHSARAAILAVLATLLFAYSALFATWHRIF